MFIRVHTILLAKSRLALFKVDFFFWLPSLLPFLVSLVPVTPNLSAEDKLSLICGIIP